MARLCTVRPPRGDARRTPSGQGSPDASCMSKKRRPPQPQPGFARWVLADGRRTRRLLRVLRALLAALTAVGLLLTPYPGAVAGEIVRSVSDVAG